MSLKLREIGGPAFDVMHFLTEWTPDFIRLWCLARHRSKYGDPDGLLPDNRFGWICLAHHMVNFSGVTPGICRIKREFLNDYWKYGTRDIPGEDYDSSPEKVISVIYSRFADEGITGQDQIIDIAKEFSSNVDELIRIVSSGSPEEVVAHADKWLAVTGEVPVRIRRRRRRQ